MGKPDKILHSVLSSRQDQNVRFTDLLRLLQHLGFTCHVRGSHHIHHHPQLPEILNLQPRKDGKAKPYQVRQCRQLITHHRLGLDP